MRRKLLILSTFVVIIFSALTGLSQTTKAPSLLNDKFILVEGHKIHYQTGGAGNATVVFESGHGDDLHGWDNVYSEVARFAKVFRYDREGYGLSDSNTAPTSYKQIATRLHELLQNANVKPPYILAGHSLGGALIRAFAFLYPNEMAGLVFVDPVTEAVEKTMTAEQKTQLMKMMDESTDGMQSTYIAEWQIMKKQIMNGDSELISFGALPDIPMVLFASGKNRPPGWEQGQQDFFSNKMHDLSETRFIKLPQSGHYIQDFEPSLVIENIRRVVFPNAENILRKTLAAKGVDSCIAEFKKLKAVYPKEYITENILSNLGSEQLNNGHTQQAIQLSTLNVQTFPNNIWVYYNLGDAYAKAGNKKEAIKNYKECLAKYPGNFWARQALQHMK